MKADVASPVDDGAAFLAGGSETAKLLRAIDWSAAPIGAPDAWPQSLKAALQIVLASSEPMVLFWGDRLTTFYNDAAGSLLDGHGSAALGRPAAEAWRNAWDQLGLRLDATLADAAAGRPTSQPFPLTFDADDFAEPLWRPTSMHGDDGEPAGVLCTLADRQGHAPPLSPHAPRSAEQAANDELGSDRERLEAELRESERRFRLVVDAVSDYIFDWDLVTGRVTRHEGAQRMFGYSASEIEADQHWAAERIHANDRRRAMERLDDAMRGGGDHWRDEFRFRRADGSYAHVLARAHFVRDAAGKALRMIGSMTDLTETNRIKEALRSTERRYHHLVQSLPAAVYTTDAEGRIQLYNDAAVELWGLSPELGKSLWCGSYRIFTPEGESLALAECPMAQALRERRPIRGAEILIQRPDGTRRHVLAHPEPMFDAAGRLIGGVNMLVDITDRKHAEDAQTRLAAIVESSDDAIISMTLDAHIVSWNNGAERIFGYSAQEAIGRSVTMLMPDERETEEQEILARISRGEQVEHFETVRRRRDGRLLDVSLTVSPLRDGAGRVIGASKIARDVSHRKQAERALRESEERFARFMRHLPGLAWIKDNEGRYVFANDAAERAFGKDGGELFGRSDHDLFPPETAEQFRANDRDAACSDTGVETIETLEHGDGVHHSLVSKFPIPGPDGAPSMIGGIAIDVTERLNAERALRDSEARFRAVMTNAPVAVFIKDLDGRYTMANPLASEALGRPDGAEGYTDHELLPAEVADRIRRVDLQVISSGRSSEQEEIVERAGYAGEFLSVKFPLRDGEGQIVGVCGVAVDVTDRKRAQQALRESDQRLRLVTQMGKLGVWDWDIANDRISWSESLYAIHGVNSEWFTETVGGFSSLVHPDDRDTVARGIRDAMEHDAPYELEFRAVRPDGATIWLFTNAVVLRDAGQPVRMLGATMDITERKRSEMALRESEERFRTLASHAPVGIFRAEPNGENVFVNENWCAMTGMAPEQALGSGWMEAVHPDDREAVAEGWQDALDHGAPSIAEFRFLRPDGVIIWVQGNAAPLRDAAGELVGYIGTVADITQHKRAEEALRNSERMYRAIGESIDYGIWVCDAEGRNIYASESFLQLVGLTQGECSDFGWAAALHPDDVEQTVVAWQQCVRSGLPWDVEHRFRGVDGRWRPVLARGVPVRDDAGKITAWVGINLDISQLKQAENELRESEARFRSMADNAPVLIWINGVGGCQFVNREYLRFAGCKPENVAGMNWTELLHPADRDAYVKAYLDAFERQCTFEAQVRMRRFDGQWRWLSCSGAPRLRADGTFLGHIGCSVDVTDIKASEEALREADRRKDDFLAMLGHELRNPLAGIVTGAQVLSMLDLAGEAREMQGVIARQASHMSQIVDDLLDVSRIARGKLTLRHQHVNLSQLVGEAVEDYRRSNDLNPSELRCTAPLDDVWAWADPTRITQALTNIVHNSFKFSSGDKDISVEMTVDPDRRLAAIEVIDRGIGMTQETLDRIFEPFNQADTSLERSRGGLGLGLALAKGLVELHGGSVAADSQGLGHGATFTITLPCEQQPGAGAEPIENGFARTRRVLIIDDRRDAILPLNRMLQLEGHRVVTAIDGPSGLAKAREFAPDVILCDIGLAGDMNGYDVSRALRCDAQFAEAYLVAVTGYGQEEDRRHAKEAGFDYHVTKPLNREQVANLMTNMPRF